VQAITKAVSVTLAAGLPRGVAIQSVGPVDLMWLANRTLLVRLERNGKQRGCYAGRGGGAAGPMEATSRAPALQKDNYTPLVLIRSYVSGPSSDSAQPT